MPWSINKLQLERVRRSDNKRPPHLHPEPILILFRSKCDQNAMCIRARDLSSKGIRVIRPNRLAARLHRSSPSGRPARLRFGGRVILVVLGLGRHALLALHGRYKSLCCRFFFHANATLWLVETQGNLEAIVVGKKLGCWYLEDVLTAFFVTAHAGSLPRS